MNNPVLFYKLRNSRLNFFLRYLLVMKKLPPIEKIYEAYTAIADNRVKISESLTLETGQATVISSDRTKEYTIEWLDGTYSSNDNSTFWQNYAGYPVIAVLMLQGYLPYNTETAEYFKGVNWKLINTRHKNDYAAALDEVITQKGLSPDELEKIILAVQNVYSHLQNLDIKVGRLRRKSSRQ